MKIIGITGPTGAGKTTALEVIREMGGAVIDCDAVYHDLLAHSDALCRTLTERFGSGILDAEGKPDRKRLGAVVFQDAQALTELNAVTHRYVSDEVMERLAGARAAGCPVAAVDAIALIESGLDKNCDAVVGILAPAEDRIRRIMDRDGISEEYARMRVNAQKGESFFRMHCTYILENNGVLPTDFSLQARSLFQSILSQI